MLNGSSGRSYHLGFSDDREFRLIGTDGGLLPKPVVTERIFLSPGERAEIVVDLRPDEQVLLRSYPADAAHRGRIDSRLARRFGLKDTVDVLTLRTGRVLGTSAEVPARLAEIAPIAPASSIPRRNFDLQWHMINHERMAMSRIDFAVTEGTTEVWGVRNVDNWPHNFHVHDVQFQVLTINDRTPPPELRGRKDTLYLAPGDRATIAMTFSGPSDPMHPYMFHCHLLGWARTSGAERDGPASTAGPAHERPPARWSGRPFGASTRRIVASGRVQNLRVNGIGPRMRMSSRIGMRT